MQRHPFLYSFERMKQKEKNQQSHPDAVIVECVKQLMKILTKRFKVRKRHFSLGYENK